MRHRPLIAAVAVLFLSACDDPAAPRSPGGGSPSAAISDGARGGNPDFFWLSPLAANPEQHANWDDGGFNPALLVQVDVCRLDRSPLEFPPGTPGMPNPNAARCVAGPPVAHFGPSDIAVSIAEESYGVQWKTDELEAGAFYRMFAYVGTREPPGIVLGFLDLFPVDKGIRKVASGEVMSFQDGRTLPIRFRVERGALCENRNACVETTVTNDNPNGDHQAVALAGPSGTIAGALFPDGWLPADGPQSVVVTIERVNTGINDVATGTQQFPCHPDLPLQQFEGCFRFTTQPVLARFVEDGVQRQFALDVTVAGCFVLHDREPADPREPYTQLWASGPDEETRPLKGADAPSSILTNQSCEGALGFLGAPSGTFAVVNAAFDRLGNGLARVFGVRTAEAVDLGLGGLMPEFSNVGPAVSARIDAASPGELTALAGSSVVPSVRVLGTAVHDGSPHATGLPNVPVTFAVASGNGILRASDAPPTSTGVESITVNTAQDDDEETPAGVALVRWTVPTTPGTYTLTATAAARGGPVTFTATVPPLSIQLLSEVTSAQAVDGVVEPPSVMVRDASGSAMPGVEVTFATVSGGSVISDSVATTNSDGVATLGSWQLGPTPTMNVVEARAAGAVPVQISVRGTWLQRFALGAMSACLIDAGNQVRCWGDNSFGALGSTGIGVTAPTVTSVPSLARFTSTGATGFCGFAQSGAVICWGRATNGMLTVPGVTSSPPIAIAGGPYEDVSLGRLSACGVTAGGVGYCWGTNQRGEIGSLSVPGPVAGVGFSSSAVPVAVDGGHSFSSIVAGWLHACGLTVEGSAYCWGAGDRLGAGDHPVGPGGTPLDSISRVPLAVEGGHTFTQLATGPHHTCGLTTAGRAWCWGQNTAGQLGDGTQVNSRVPVEVATQLRFSSIEVSDEIIQPQGTGYTCALTEKGEPHCWGSNSRGQLGDGTTTDRLTPTPVGGGLRLTALDLGWWTSCGMRGESIWCWGGNTQGTVGDGSTVDRLLPIRIWGGSID